MDSDDEVFTLSASTLAALAEFKTEEKQRQEHFEKLSQAAQDKYDKVQKEKLTMEAFKEDWQLSQFWYSDETAAILGHALLDGADEDTVIVIASAPSVYAAIQKFPENEIPTKHIYLFEFDKRFEVLAGKEYFYFYDYNHPNDIPDLLKHKVDRILIDPPFLEPECQTNSAKAAFNLLKKDRSGKTKSGDNKYKIISCTGERMKHIIRKNYPETRMTDFYPEHSQLSNEFRCYASFETPTWKYLPDAAQGDEV